ncbi:hypothetical protein [Thiomicrorhabdus indica]|uniref:hypothetical protein n=1 Tax=Thiomicrorhabdus indica TaxID=2267253 RepID=UPI001F105B83|nr:hypothetical protein [Thiomicrorhabdus indica]
MKKTFASLAIAASIAFSGQAMAGTDVDSMMDKAAKLHSEAKDLGVVWKQKAMKKPYYDTYVDQVAAAKEKGDMAKAKTAAELAMKTAEGELKQAQTPIKAAWEK